MDESQVLSESIENLFYFEYYKFKRSFGFAYLIIGSLVAIVDILFFYNYTVQNDTNADRIPSLLVGYLSLITLLAICLFLVFVVRSVNKTQIINGVLVKSRTLIGILIIIIGIFFSNTIVIVILIFIFNIISPQLLNYNYDIIIQAYASILILLGVYYAETKLFFPNERNRSCKIFSLIMVVLYFACSIVWFIFFFLPFSNTGGYSITYLNNFYPFLYIIIISNNILLGLYGFYEMRNLPRIRRDLVE